jgi:hypothetical protein
MCWVGGVVSRFEAGVQLVDLISVFTTSNSHTKVFPWFCREFPIMPQAFHN